MRTREEIEEEWKWGFIGWTINDLILEILLDIRDLLTSEIKKPLTKLEKGKVEKLCP